MVGHFVYVEGSVKNQVPKSNNKRHCSIASSEEESNNTAPDYQKALEDTVDMNTD